MNITGCFEWNGIAAVENSGNGSMALNYQVTEDHGFTVVADFQIQE